MESTIAQSEIGAALDRYELHDPAAAKKIYDLRTAMGVGEFSSQLWSQIFERPASASLRFAAGLLDFGDLVQTVIRRHRQSREQGIALARKLQVSDSKFDSSFFKLFSDKHATGWSRETFLAVIDILDAISERDRLVLAVSKFLKDPDPDIRSKVSLFIARRRPTVAWATDISREPHPKVRAHILEGLFEAREDFVDPLFRKYAGDEDSRVAGNAVLGLYHLGDIMAISIIGDLAKDARPEFRAASAWIMGQSGDPRFSSNLAGLLSDTDERVRKNALLALGDIKRATALARSQISLRSVLLKRGGDQGRQNMIATLCKPSGEAVRGVLATRFILRVGGAYLREYNVEEYSCSTPLNAGLIFCDPPKGDNNWGIDFQEIVEERCNAIRRSRDNLVFSKLTHETHLRCYASDARASTSVLTNAMEEIGFGSPNLNLIMVGLTPHTRAVERLTELASNSDTRCHVIAVAPEWRTPELRQRVQESGGYFQVAEPADVAQCCLDVFASLLHHYRLGWNDKAEGCVELEIRSPEGTAITSFQADCPQAQP